MQRYNLHEELGNGSFGTVYRATLKENSNQEVSNLPRFDMITFESLTQGIASLCFFLMRMNIYSLPSKS